MRDGGLETTTDPRRLANVDVLVIAVPTPVDGAHIPDVGPLIGASITVGQDMKMGANVIYGSTIYPGGGTEEDCIPVPEEHSGLKRLDDFHVGYSLERINFGDRKHTLTRVVKVVSGDCPQTLERAGLLCGIIIAAGAYKVASIRVAEAAKDIENTQHDFIFALIKESAII